ncbi:MAG: hypothetical protein M1833_000313 [Piccolia ochrophora]|nr:MAG: hypothetical protein M1833_000313 [Piccolia ochrophora]
MLPQARSRTGPCAPTCNQEPDSDVVCTGSRSVKKRHRRPAPKPVREAQASRSRREPDIDKTAAWEFTQLRQAFWSTGIQPYDRPSKDNIILLYSTINFIVDFESVVGRWEWRLKEIEAGIFEEYDLAKPPPPRLFVYEFSQFPALIAVQGLMRRITGNIDLSFQDAIGHAALYIPELVRRLRKIDEKTFRDESLMFPENLMDTLPDVSGSKDMLDGEVERFLAIDDHFALA